MIKIMLDAGHYGKYNQSPANPNYYESETMWNLHLRLKKYLEEYEVEVLQTRADKNVDLPVYERGKKSKGCDLLISLHSNSVADSKTNESVDYPLAYVQLNGKGNAIGELLSMCVANTMVTKQAPRYASQQGKNGDYHGVLRGATAVGTTGVILEHSFHTNTRSTNWLLDGTNIEKLAKNEALVIASYLGLKKRAKTHYKIQVASFTNKDYAEDYLKKVRDAGFKDAFIFTSEQ